MPRLSLGRTALMVLCLNTLSEPSIQTREISAKRLLAPVLLLTIFKIDAQSSSNCEKSQPKIADAKIFK
jgi:hypothetical protein